MKRSMLAVVVIVVFVAGYVTAEQPWEGAAAQDPQSILVHTTGPASSGGAGDECLYGRAALSETIYAANSGAQLVIENEAGTIILTQELTGTIEATGDGSLACTAQFPITLPDASFYSVRVGETFVRTYDASSFPLDDTSSGLLIGFD